MGVGWLELFLMNPIWKELTLGLSQQMSVMRIGVCAKNICHDKGLSN